MWFSRLGHFVHMGLCQRRVRTSDLWFPGFNHCTRYSANLFLCSRVDVCLMGRFRASIKQPSTEVLIWVGPVVFQVQRLLYYWSCRYSKIYNDIGLQVTPRRWIHVVSTLVLKISSTLFSLLLSTDTCHNFLTGQDACWLPGGGGGGSKQRRAWRKYLNSSTG